MVGQEQLESSPLCQHSDNETETKRECSVVIPDDWQLTSQQQAFIELELSNQVQRFFEVNFIRCFPT
ncbi:hypothetical protein [Escherichia coli]|uniref:hypothetical protein n=1 Tax=Escherichia coli TaxID=562 RepID=UPI00227F4C33|nr:hypothetical protein [Escherichia coli]